MGLEPLSQEHRDALAAAAVDGELWRMWFTSVPEQDGTSDYIDIVLSVDRVEIGCTWYARRCQQTHLNTACKWLHRRSRH